jgi:tetratricopeptide (TPR) repeat protein
MVSDFRDRVDAEIESDDFETRYNLGIAYRGMGLLDEAIGEFQRAARDPERLFDCASLLAACFEDKGLPQLAVSWLERGLEVPGRSDEEYQELRYELACALELVGDAGRAARMFVELYGENARLRDVAEKVKRLASPPAREGTGTSDASGERRGIVLPWRRE